MDLITSPRHTRRGFTNRVRCARGLLLSLHSAQEAAQPVEKERIESSRFLALLAEQIENDCAEKSGIDNGRATFDFSPTASNTSRYKRFVQTDIRADGQRVELSFNGGKVIKDTLGQVVEVQSVFGDSLFFQYGSFGQLEMFTRLDSRGALHSAGKFDKHGVKVTDSQGRVLAVGQNMAVDPWGRLYVHSHSGQYVCLDLISGFHIERRQAGEDFVTAMFAQDGFRMATMYALAPDVMQASRNRCLSYRFYGRDGTVLEFNTASLKVESAPIKAMPPGSRPIERQHRVHWQAKTAKQALKEYLAR
ncbi:MAG: hypothetical protein K2W82_15310 [Candidatus Obscuribacterales bacterium]|nr:hypothetical protein [Candidatus Obscuribacterales bacterium]